jgi:hypothetical protein
MEYSAEDSYMEKECMNPVHHIFDDASDSNDPRLEDETNNAQVVTWFTFYSHRAQREYYYEPISGTTTWIAPSLTTTSTEEGAECVISRLPGSPLESMQDAVKNGTRLYEKRVLPVITQRPVALLLLIGNMVLFASLYSSFQNGTTLPQVATVWIQTLHASWFTSSQDHSIMTPMDDSLEKSEPSVILDTHTFDTENKDIVGEVSPEESQVDIFDDLVDVAVADPDIVVVTDASPKVAPFEPSGVDPAMMDSATVVEDPLPGSDANEDIMHSNDDHGRKSEMDDAVYVAGGVDEETILTASFTEVVDEGALLVVDQVERDVEAVVPVETDNVVEAVEPDVTADGAAIPLETPVVVNDELVEEPNEAPAETVAPLEAVMDDEETVSSDVEEIGAVEMVLEETLHRIQKEGDMVVQRVALVATQAGYRIELEPNLTTAGFAHAPLELLMQGGAAV